ncbi:hypothetical protein CDAR_402811 [Caerostris darwini]|uniref:Uncharacterized protein n=1 Tax=Caerostris darwini TaxID=1538125 RepID=A0AAV4N548_9ARAC|nr:hypothetical protein CDAR_402811 [Caerostris darwini]
MSYLQSPLHGLMMATQKPLAEMRKMYGRRLLHGKVVNFAPGSIKRGKRVLDNVTSLRFRFGGTEATANALRERRFVKLIAFLTDCRCRFGGTEAATNALRERRFVKFIAFLTGCRCRSAATTKARAGTRVERHFAHFFASGSVKRVKRVLDNVTSLLFTFNGTEAAANALRERRFVKFIAFLTKCRCRSAARTKAKAGTKVERHFAHFCRLPLTQMENNSRFASKAVERKIQYIDLQFPTGFINSLQFMLRPRVLSLE